MKIAIDLGGTSLRLAQIEDQQILKSVKVKCPAQSDEKAVLDAIIAGIRQLMTPAVDEIGIGVPSVVDAELGIVYDVANIPSWREVHLKEIIERETGIPTFVDNDVNCFVLGEKYFGAGRQYDDVVGITLGTGVGAGIITNGHLYRGANTGAGEVGSLPYLDSDYEHYCSSLFLKRCGTLTGEELVSKAAEGDEAALRLWEQLGFHVGKLLQVLLFTYDPQAIIIGGGLTAAAPYFEASMRKSMAEGFPYARTVEKVKVCWSSLQGSNLLGASMLHNS
ncbi:MAG: ROK family protein [Prevotella sp.]|jgi:glucokinase|nr:ROK family protein [Prevotella sp.]MCI1281267.1 ROK family protein [Prevotella sp.]